MLRIREFSFLSLLTKQQHSVWGDGGGGSFHREDDAPHGLMIASGELPPCPRVECFVMTVSCCDPSPPPPPPLANRAENKKNTLFIFFPEFITSIFLLYVVLSLWVSRGEMSGQKSVAFLSDVQTFLLG